MLANDSLSDYDVTSGLERLDVLDRPFKRLSVEHRAVLVLTHYLGYSPREVAVMLGIPAGTVHSRLHYGAAAMRRSLGRGAPATSSLGGPA